MSATMFLTSTATAMLLATAGAASAREPAAPVSAPMAAAVNADSLSQRYCIVGEVTGSRIPRRACASLGEWQAQDIDPRTMRRVSSSRSSADQ